MVAGATTVGAGEDFASTAYGDPWDFENPEDVLLDAGPTMGVDAAAIADGALAFTSHTGAQISLVFPGYAGAFASARDGLGVPIDADRFTHAAVRIWSPDALTMGLGYNRCMNGCVGNVTFFAQAGWGTYLVALGAPAAGLAQGEPWAGDVVGLRLVVAIGDGVARNFLLDDVRLFAPAGPAWTFTWPNPLPNTPGQPAQILWDRDADTSNNTADSRDWGVLAETYDATGAATFTPGMLGAGPVWLATAAAGLTSPSVGPFTVVPTPVPRVLDPDAAGGADAVTVQTGDPWDFEQASDVIAFEGVRDVAFADGGLHATNATNDPSVELRTGGPIDTTRYHRLTVVADYDGAFDLGYDPGGGAHGRVLWWPPGRAGWVNGREIVTYSSVHRYTVDLLDNAGGPAYDDDEEAVPWDAASAVRIRYDPNEDPGARRWRLHELRLAADDETSGGQFTIRWDDPASLPGTSVEWYADTDRVGFDGVAIAGPIAQQPGENALAWDARAMPPGRYWLYAVSRAGVATGRAYATGPVVVDPTQSPPPTQPPPAPPQPLPTELPAGTRIAGPSRIATAIAVAQAAFPAGAQVAVLARDDAFPDALAASPLAAAHGAPILLNPPGQLHPDVSSELVRLGTQTVLLMGGEAAQGAAVESDLRARGLTVQRVSGDDRFATAAAAAALAVAGWREAGKSEAGSAVVIATGSSFADALAAGPLAAARNAPLLLVAAEGIPAPTAAVLGDLQPAEVVIVGGEAALTPAVESSLASTGRSLTRLHGPDRFATGIALTEAAVAAGASPAEILVVSGTNFPDALSAAPAAAAINGLLILTDPATVAVPVESWLRSQGASVGRLRVVGGPGAVADTTVATMLDLLASSG